VPATTPSTRRTPTALLGAAPALLVGVGLAILLESLRVWMASVLHIYGEPGQTPALELALFAGLPFLLALAITPPALSLMDWRRVVLATAAILGAGRLALQATPGGDWQLIIATVAVVGGLTWAAAIAASSFPRREVAVGIVGGLAFDGIGHALLRSTPLPWRGGPLAWLAALALVTLLAWLAWAAVRASASTEHPAALAAPAWPWLLLAPLLPLHGIVAPVSRLHTVTGWPEAAAVAVIAAAHIAALAAATTRLRLPTRTAGVIASGLVLIGLYAIVTVGMPFETPPVLAAGHVLVIVGLGLGVAAIGRTTSRTTPPQRALVTLAALALGQLLVIAHYAGYDVPLPFTPTAVLWVAAAGFAILASLGRADPERLPYPWLPGRTVAASVLVIGLTASVTVPIAASSPPVEADGAGLPVRVMTYNLNMGFSPAGVFGTSRMADVIRAESPDIVALQEVDRGWFITGGTDPLPRLSEQVGMPYVFAAAADDVWGNAVLSRYPIADVRSDPLPRGEPAMSRGALTVIVEVDEEEVAVVSTHLHHVAGDTILRQAQAERVAGIARSLRDQGLPVVVMGDMNAEPAAPELEPLRRVLSHGSGGRGAPPTWPAADPVETIDHIWVSPDLSTGELSVPEVAASDHLPVAVTVTRGE
jgi:endonuclease/exonuclease/phosphatase family metal-dependent hydrolase